MKAVISLEFLEQIKNYSYCDYISDLKYSCRWQIGVRTIFYRENIEHYPLWEWKNAMDYILNKDISVKTYQELALELDKLLKS